MPTTESARSTPEPGDHRRPLFELGRIFATPGAVEALDFAHERFAASDALSYYLDRHVTGDWGDLGDDDKDANDAALVIGARILSAYTLPTDERLWIITEADRAYTTLLTPLEY
ncbi:MAG: hypothetical protein IT332_13050 [Ardenticatenales bacterium]|nr:hypothetical protein [Ardenticatenales bacterium]